LLLYPYTLGHKTVDRNHSIIFIVKKSFNHIREMEIFVALFQVVLHRNMPYLTRLEISYDNNKTDKS
jgi:hypothetical protein